MSSTNKPWDNFKQPNVHITRVSKEEERDGGTEKYLEKQWSKDFQTDENYKPTNIRSKMNFKHKKHEDNHTLAHHN